jgi:hypothetical protein
VPRSPLSAGALRQLGWLAFATGIIAAIGLAFLIAMYALFATDPTSAVSTSPALAFGRINDTLGIVGAVLMLPLAWALHVLLRPHAPLLRAVAMTIGLGAMLAIAVLQSFLVAGTLTFEAEVGPVLIAFLALGVWLVLTGYLGKRSGVLPKGLRMGLLGATYIGYPIWAFWLGRHLLHLAGEPIPGLASTRAEGFTLR